MGNQDKKDTDLYNRTVEAYKMARTSEKPAEPIEDEYSPGEAPLLAQAGRGMMDVYQGSKQLALNVGEKMGMGDAEGYNKQLEEELGLYNKSNPGIQPARIAGNIATPLSLIPGSLGRTAVQRGASTLGAGGAFGATQPVEGDEDYWNKKATQTAIGAALAPVAPLAIRGGQAIGNFGKRVTRPFSDEGITADLADLFQKEAGDADSVQKIVQAITSRKTYVPGNAPTVGQSIADATRGTGDDYGAALVRLEKELGSEGIEGQVLRSQAAQQAAGRKGVIDAIAGTDADLAAAEAARKAGSLERYSAAYSKRPKITEKVPEVVPPQPTGILSATGEQIMSPETVKFATRIESNLRKLIKDPFLKKAVPMANNLAKAEGITLKSNPIKYLHYVKIGLDKQLSKTGDDALSNTEKRAVREIKGKLVDWIGGKSPAYSEAREGFARESIPINRMEVGRELQKGLSKSSDLSAPMESPAPFLGAVRDAPRTLKRGTGFNRYNELGDVLTPEQTRGVQNVANELLRKQQQDAMGRSVSPILNKLETEIEPRLPRILERNVVIANAVLRKLGMDKSPDYQRVAIDILQNPDKILPLLKLPESDPRRLLAMEIMKNLPKQVPAQTGARTSVQENQ